MREQVNKWHEINESETNNLAGDSKMLQILIIYSNNLNFMVNNLNQL